MTSPSQHDRAHEELDLTGAITRLVDGTPRITQVFLFGSRVHRTQSLRSDIDLLVFGEGLSAAKMSALQWEISPYLDVFIVSGSTAVSATNQSMIPADSVDQLLQITQAQELWNQGWTGDAAFATQDVRKGHAPTPTVAVVGAEYLSVASVDYLLVTALASEYHAAVAALGETTSVGNNDRSLISHETAVIQTPGGDKNVAVVLLPNVGLVAAALTTSRLLDAHDVGLVILLGITGAIQDENVSLGDLVLPNQIFDYGAAKAVEGRDLLNPCIAPVPRPVYRQVRAFDFEAWGARVAKSLKNGTKAGPPRVHLDRTMASGHKVIADAEQAALLRETDRKTLAVEMESYGVAEACRATAPETAYLVIKGISDWANAEKDDAWHEYCCEAAALLAVDLIRTNTV